MRSAGYLRFYETGPPDRRTCRFHNDVDKAEQIQFKKKAGPPRRNTSSSSCRHFYAFNALPYGLHAPDLVIIDEDPNAQTTDPFVLKNAPEMIKAIRIGLTAENHKREEKNAKKLEKFNGLSSSSTITGSNIRHGSTLVAASLASRPRSR